MNNTDIMRFITKAVSLGLIMMLSGAFSMYAVSGSMPPVGELMVSGEAVVTVNGEPAKTGRTIFASSTITTPDSTGATLNLGKSGKLDLAPNTTFVITSDGDVIGGDLTAGSVTAVGTASKFGIKTSAGEMVNLAAGETALSGLARATRDYRDKTTGKCIDDDNDGKEECFEGLPRWGWYAIAGGIAAAVIIAVVATRDDDSTAVSPIR